MLINEKDLSLLIFILLTVGLIYGDAEMVDSNAMKILSTIFFVTLILSKKPLLAYLYMLVFITDISFKYSKEKENLDI